jgi:hypothetical protein
MVNMASCNGSFSLTLTALIKAINDDLYRLYTSCIFMSDIGVVIVAADRVVVGGGGAIVDGVVVALHGDELRSLSMELKCDEINGDKRI